MDTLTSVSFGYSFDDLVYVQVSAENDFGISTPTQNLNGARIRSKPGVMTTPVISSYSDTQIVVTWTALAAPTNGNSDITSYVLYWN